MCELVGYTRDELLDGRFQDITHPADLDADLRLVGELLTGDISRYRLPKRYLDRDGDVVEVVLHVSLVRDERGRPLHFVAQVEDVGELRKTASRLEALMVNLHTAILVENEDRAVELTNQAFCDMFQVPMTPDELRGADCVAMAESAKQAFVDPERFVRRVEELLAHRERVTGEIVRLTDGRVLERDYVPVFAGEQYCGHLWSYRDVTERERARDQLAERAARYEETARRDALTGLFNRHGLATVARERFAEHTGAARSVFFVDLDGMKQANDERGHEAGDALLLQAAEVLRATFRGEDLLARVGGDEFVAVCAGVDEASAERIIARIRSRADREDPPVQMSVGFAIAATADERLEDLLRRADAAMYADKRRRRAGR
jgi:diguanylate cyclase (GGDEF)-like protein/PAS domain S-box-containing protein